jgi:Peptidase C26
MAPLIGISGRRLSASVIGRMDPRFAQREFDFFFSDYARCVSEVGGTPVHLPYGADGDAVMPRLDCVIITGGQDIHPARWGEDTSVVPPDADPRPDSSAHDTQRDGYESAIIAAAMRTGVPLLGVCRGHQMLNVALGGTLVTDLPPSQVERYPQDAPLTDGAELLDPGRVSGRVTDMIEGEADLDGVDLVINLSGPFFAGADSVARVTLKSGTAYIDFGDDLEATDTIPKLDAEAKAAGVPLIIGAGWSPDVSNWLAVRLIEENPTTDGIQVVWATHESDPGGLAPLRHMLHMAVSPCPLWVDGGWTQSPGFVPETAATYDFPDPLGSTGAYDMAHQNR